MGSERRRAERVRANLPVRWEGFMEAGKGTVSDISTSGCFIMTGGMVVAGELVCMELSVPAVCRMQLWGNVVYSFEPIGFALRFSDMKANEQTMLARLIERLRAANSGTPATQAQQQVGEQQSS